MRISRDKLNKLAHTVADTLADIDQVGFNEDRNTIRQEARKALETLLTQEAGIDAADGQQDYYLRQLRDWKMSAEIEQLNPKAMKLYAQLYGVADPTSLIAEGLERFRITHLAEAMGNAVAIGGELQ